MPYDELLAARVRSSFARQRAAFTEKRMMGGLCFLVDDKMCVGVEKDRLMVRLDPAVYEDVLARDGCRPMDLTGRPLRGFVFIDADAVKDEKRLTEWIKMALEFNPRARSAKSSKAKRNKMSS